LNLNNKKLSNRDRETAMEDKYFDYIEMDNRKYSEKRPLITQNFNTIGHPKDRILNSRVPLASRPTYNYRKHDLDKLNILTTEYLSTKMKSIK
jgi:hypothetical protein